MRAITRELDGKPRTLFTSLMDPARYKAEEVFALYHERWEIELAYGEMKTDMLGRAMTLRSQQPDRVRKRAVGNLVDVQPDPAWRSRASQTRSKCSPVASASSRRCAVVDEWLWSSGSHTPWGHPANLPP